MKTINIKSQTNEYQIIIDNNILSHVEDFLSVDRFYVIVSDNQIPQQYVSQVASSLSNNMIIRFPAGEQSKSFYEYERIISILQENNISRDACLVALGGGVTGDLVGFVASTYLRGIDYVQIPTTLLAQIDSSVGGKVAINTNMAKNSVGSFYPPIKVIVDINALETLSSRQFNSGMAEMIKYGMIHSKQLFEQILREDIKQNIESLIYESIIVKKYYVENDEHDKGLRQMLNYGHTFGHAYEAYYNYQKYLHGEAISLGMVKVCDIMDVKIQLISALQKFDLPISDLIEDEKLIPYILKDKKNLVDHINMIIVNEIGKSEIVKKTIQEVSK